MVKRFPISASIGGGALLMAVLVFMLLPLAIVAASSVTAGAFLTFPPQGLSLRWYGQVLASDAYLDAARTSLILATAGDALVRGHRHGRGDCPASVAFCPGRRSFRRCSCRPWCCRRSSSASAC